MLLPRSHSYEEIYRAFEWNIPQFHNIADEVCDRHADTQPDKVALIADRKGRPAQRYTYADIRRHANRLANWMTSIGLERGDRVSIQLAQAPEAALTHIACWKAGLVSSPMSVLFGTGAVEYRLRDLGSRVVVTDLANLPKIQAVLPNVPAVEHVLVIDGTPGDALNFWDVLEGQPEEFENVRTRADELAFINYTSGTTGNPKGAMQPHSVVLGYMPGVEFMFDYSTADDVIWSPADWAWVAGMISVLLCSWSKGATVIASDKAGFDAEDACRIMSEHGVTCTILTPTMLKMLRQAPEALERHKVAPRVIMSGSESLGKELLRWSNETFGCAVNEAFGQTECNAILGNCASVLPIKPGSLGRPIPGRVVAIVDDDGNELPVGTVGKLAVKAPDPVMMIGYWNRPDATREKYIGDWLITGDMASVDEDGYFWFQGRADDVINSSGYRIGPGEIEDTLLEHPSVAMAAVVGVPDPERTEAIKAFIVLKPGHAPGEALERELRELVRTRLARYEYPREIEFIDSMPMTATGKILRRELRERHRTG